MNLKEFRRYYQEYSNIYLKYFYNKNDASSDLTLSHHINNRANQYIDYRNLDLVAQCLSGEYQSPRRFKLLDLGCGGLDKSLILRKLFPLAELFGVEAKISDDPGHREINKYRFNKPEYYQVLKKKYNLNFGLYDGRNLKFSNSFFDVIMLYATLEHIVPNERKEFIAKISKKLKKNGLIIVTRCPQKNGLFETISEKLSLGAHLWRLTKDEFNDIFPSQQFEMIEYREMNNIFTEPAAIANFFFPILVVLDRLLEYLKWPFFSDYFLVLRKRK